VIGTPLSRPTRPAQHGRTPAKPIGSQVMKRSDRRAWTCLAAAAALLAAGGADAAEPKAAPPPPAAVKRELPEGASEAQVRRHCTRQYDAEALIFNDPTASGWGGISDAQLLEAFRRCMLRHGVRP
jgi:hypothetical protein